MAFRFFKKPDFTPSQLDRISNILDSAGQVLFGGVVLAPLVEGIDKTGTPMLVLGAIYVAVCWASSIIIARRKDKISHDI